MVLGGGETGEEMRRTLLACSASLAGYKLRSPSNTRVRQRL